MDAVSAPTIQALLDEIGSLTTAIKDAGSEGRTRLKEIKVDEAFSESPVAAGRVDEPSWSALPKDVRTERYHRLVQVRDSLRVAAGLDGPTEPNHIMFGAYASNRTVVISTVFAFLLVSGLLCTIAMQWGVATRTDFAPQVTRAVTALAQVESAEKAAMKANAAEGKARNRAAGLQEEAQRTAAQLEVDSLSREAQARHVELQGAKRIADSALVIAVKRISQGGATEAVVLRMVMLLGALGGSLHLLRSLVNYIGNRQLKRSWLLYYVSLPLVSGGLAAIVYMLLRVGVLTPPAAADGGSTTTDLNLIGIYAFAAMTGLFAGAASEKLREVFGTIFRTPDRSATKDPMGDKSSGTG